MSTASPPAQSPLLRFRLSRQDFQQQVVRARETRTDTAQRDARPAKKQAIVIRGYNDDATAAIRIAAGGREEVLKASYILGKEMVTFSTLIGAHISTIVEQVEDALLIPSKHWRLTSKSAARNPEDTLIRDCGDAIRSRPVGLLLVPEDAVVDYLSDSKNETMMLEWKRLKPSTPPQASLVDVLAQAQSMFHLLVPSEDKDWGQYMTRRQDAEWSFVRVRERLGCMEMSSENLLDTINYATRSILERTGLTAEEQAAVSDGVLPQGVDAEDDGGDCVRWKDVTVLTRTFSPTRPAMIDVHLRYRERGNLDISYRIHNSLSHPTSTAGKDSLDWSGDWRSVFHVDVTEIRRKYRHGQRPPKNVHWRSSWGMNETDAKQVRDVLFGPLGDKVSTLDAVLFLLTTVGFRMNVRTGDDERFRDSVDGDPLWEVGDEEWLGRNIRKACGISIADEKEDEVESDDDAYCY
ncbi:hypothetical protein OH76DRAFT_1493749 [Lentinus brumalis]|uniref:Uncharacterized protein n=1 Tax=Lentinus brumalis TaxID=2498619 RepID=A0A371DYB9_9APHY|nr:hypothetical protein OH76DRAFT_1493749 [Polyporus brumalis]